MFLFWLTEWKFDCKRFLFGLCSKTIQDYASQFYHYFGLISSVISIENFVLSLIEMSNVRCVEKQLREMVKNVVALCFLCRTVQICAFQFFIVLDWFLLIINSENPILLMIVFAVVLWAKRTMKNGQNLYWYFLYCHSVAGLLFGHSELSAKLS